jgi:hypothetical protein
MFRQSLPTKWKYFLLGVVLAIGVMFTMGANRDTAGRYQISAWSATDIGFGVFITDTASGETKIAYLNIGTVKENNLGKPFQEFTPSNPSGHSW